LGASIQTAGTRMKGQDEDISNQSHGGEMWMVFSIKPAFEVLTAVVMKSTLLLVSRSAYSSTLKIEAICSSETLVDLQQTTWQYIPEDSTLHEHFSVWVRFSFNRSTSTLKILLISLLCIYLRIIQVTCQKYMLCMCTMLLPRNTHFFPQYHIYGSSVYCHMFPR
jgi:hypothetical protein